MNKKIIMFIFVILFIFNGCSSTVIPDENVNSEEDVENGKEVEIENKKNKENEKKSLSNKLSVAVLSSADPNIEKKVNSFRKQNPDLEVILNKYDNITEYNDYMKLSLQNGTMEDVFFASKNSIFPYKAERELYLADLYELINEDPYFNKDDYYFNVLKGCESNGALYIFPIDFYYNYVSINKDAPIDLINEFKQCEVISIDEMIKLYYKYGLVDDFRFSEYFRAVNGALYEVGNFLNRDDTKKSITNDQFIQILKNYSFVFDPLQESTNPEVHNIYTYNYERKDENNKKYLFEVHSSLSFMQYQYLLSYQEDKFTHAVPLASSLGDINLFVNTRYAISQSSQNKEAAWELLKYLSSEEVIGLYPDDTLRGIISINSAVFEKTEKEKFIQVYDMLQTRPNITALKDEIDDIFESIIKYINICNKKPMYSVSNSSFIYDEMFGQIRNVLNDFFNNGKDAQQTAQYLQNIVLEKIVDW